MLRILKGVTFLLLVQIVFNVVCYTAGLKHPFNIFLFDPNDRFADILKTSDAFGVANNWPGNNSWYIPLLKALPPFQILIEISFGYLSSYLNSIYSNFFVPQLLLYSLYVIIVATLFIIIKICSKNSKWAVYFFLITIFNYGFIVFLDRGNSSILTVVFLLIYFYKHDNILISMLCLAFATSLKITPCFFFIFVILINQTKLLKYILVYLLFLIVINVPSYFYVSQFFSSHLNTEYNLIEFFNGGRLYLETYLVHNGGLAYGSSLIPLLSKINQFNRLLPFSSSYLSLFSSVLLVISYFYIFCYYKYFTKNRFHFVLFIVTTFLLFSPVTGDYYLSYFIFPLVFLKDKLYLHSKYIFPLVLLLSPKNYFFYHNVSLQILINPLIMIWVLVIIHKDVVINNSEE